MENQVPTTSGRVSSLDWLRLIAIAILLFFHTGMWFNTWGWHVKNSETSVSFNYWMVWLHQWRMPLLLFISGAGTWIALGKRTLRQYAGERFKRLFIPLIFGMFVVVPPQIYYEHIREYNSYWDFYKTVFEFKPYPGGSFSWHHLWFILYLLLYSLILIPFLGFLKSDRSAKWRARVTKWLTDTRGMLWIPSLFILSTQVLLRPFFPDEKHDLTDLAYFIFYGCFFFFGIVTYSIPEVWSSVRENRKGFLRAAVLILIPFYICYLHFRDVVHLPWSEDTVDVIFSIAAIFLAWFSVITAAGWGQQLLHGSHPWLARITQGLYPFYILHQTVIIAVGYYICQTDWSIFVKFWAIALSTAVICILLIEGVIRHVKFLRLVFGLK